MDEVGARGGITSGAGSGSRFGDSCFRCGVVVVIVIRRLVDRHRAYTAIFLRGEPPRIFPTTDAEHGRILQIYKQDQRYEGILNDFTDFHLGPSPASPAKGAPGDGT